MRGHLDRKSMNDRELLRGLLLIAVALLFGLQSLRYSIGSVVLPGPGLFPLLVSCLLFVGGLTILIGSRFTQRVRLSFDFKNIGLIIASIVGFAVVSEFVNMIAGIVFAVFCASFAASSYSILRNVQISAGLVAIALALQKLLGFSLPLY
jgi:hypothetical protein